MPLPLFVVDAFTPRPFAGNPAAVCLVTEERDAAWMQSVAREMNLSETAFVTPRPDGEFDLRWFTPAVEVDLCGHATLASAHVLFELGRVPRERPARFHTRSGVLVATREGDGIALDFPARPSVRRDAPAGMIEALGAQPTWIGETRVASHAILAELASEEAVRRLAPDFVKLAQVEARAFIVTAPGSGEYDFVSRFFGPRVGINEDPVTGAAHCALASYWGPKLGKRAMTGYQASPRGGVVRVRTEGDRVILGGQAVLVSRGELLA
jgi:PhzF family phenazine biosynthesis protein